MKGYTEVDLKVLHKVKGAANAYKVPQKQWRKWSELARRVFNLHFYELKENQIILTHPKTQPISKKEWRTQAWNAAWLAADSVMDALKEMSKDYRTADIVYKQKDGSYSRNKY